jgi:hypothetical protein
MVVFFPARNPKTKAANPNKSCNSQFDFGFAISGEHFPYPDELRSSHDPIGCLPKEPSKNRMRIRYFSMENTGFT